MSKDVAWVRSAVNGEWNRLVHVVWSVMILPGKYSYLRTPFFRVMLEQGVLVRRQGSLAKGPTRPKRLERPKHLKQLPHMDC